MHYSGFIYARFGAIHLFLNNDVFNNYVLSTTDILMVTKIQKKLRAV